MDAIERLVIALAAPIVRHQGGDDRRFGGGIAADRARLLLDTLFAIKSGADARELLASFGAHGQRAEWTQYQHHAGGAWKPGPEDASVIRKAEYTIANRDRLGDRGLVALDASRSCAIAGWALAAGLLTREQALAAIGRDLLISTVKVHRSWAELAGQLRLAFEFTDGACPPDVDAAITALETGAGPWHDLAWPPEVGAAVAAPEDDAEDEDESEEDEQPDDDSRPPALISLQLTVDCPGCGLPLSPGAIAATARCRHCATEIALGPDDWAYFFGRGVGRARAGDGNHDPYTNDFGKRFFSRTEIRRVDAIACRCGAPLAAPTIPGDLTCAACGAIATVREPDEHARAIHARVRLVVEPRPGPRPGAPAAACAACSAAVPADARVVRCPSCHVRTFVDDATWAATHGPARRAIWYLSV